MLDLATLETAHDAEKPFLEDILELRTKPYAKRSFHSCRQIENVCALAQQDWTLTKTAVIEWS